MSPQWDAGMGLGVLVRAATTRVPTHLPRTTFFGTQCREKSTGSISLVGVSGIVLWQSAEPALEPSSAADRRFFGLVFGARIGNKPARARSTDKCNGELRSRHFIASSRTRP
jgi:hypothetical protein